MIRFERSQDWETIRKIVTHPRVYPFVGDDHSPAANEWFPVAIEAVWYVLVWDASELLGCFILIPENRICWKVHTCLLPNAYGARAKEAGRKLSGWIWEHTNCQRIITDVPSYNRLALKFAKDCGMTEYGSNPKSYQKYGSLHDQVLLGISRGEELCQSQR